MELTYPYILYGGIILAAILTVVTIGRNKKYKKGNKNAGIDVIDDIPHYRFLMIEYWVLRSITVVALVVSIILSSFIASKPVKARMVTNEVHNRDIFICLDVSTSLDGVNLQLLDKLRKMVSDLKGERFGIAIFNARTVMTCPLTDDYEHVLDMIDTLEPLGVAGVGMNCSLGPDMALPIIKEFSEKTDLPLVVKSNAFMTKAAGGSGEKWSVEQYAEAVDKLLPYVSYIGGCCGADPSYMEAVAKLL